MNAHVSSSEIDRLVYHMPTVAQMAENDWAKGFAQSISRQSRRRNWRPSPKQVSVMRGLVSDLFTQASNEEGDISVIE